MTPQTIIKRDGTTVPFDNCKIETAIYRCLHDCWPELNGGEPDSIISTITEMVLQDLPAKAEGIQYWIPTVEDVQNSVEFILMREGYHDLAKAYIIYREEKRKLRGDNPISVVEVNDIREGNRYFKLPTQMVTYISKYSRWDEEKKRRETWEETVDRYINFMMSRPQLSIIEDNEWMELRSGILNLEAMPSMRALQMAGLAAERCNVCCYNCSYLPIDSWKSFSELFYCLMSGCGVGFSVESDYVRQLPKVRRRKLNPKHTHHSVPDTTEGWCDSLLIQLETIAKGDTIDFDYSLVRKQGERLKTKGGRSSGSGPLIALHKFVEDKLLSRQGEWLTTLDAHDIACMVGDVTQLGGVRRAAEISLSDIDDPLMRDAKKGNFYTSTLWRRNANNSAVYEDRPDSITFLKEWTSIIESKAGERGIFNRDGAIKQVPKRRKKTRYGLNPCLTGDMKLLTNNGYQPLESLCGKEVTLIDRIGLESIGKVWYTGEKECVSINFHGNSRRPITCTPDHIFLTVDDEEVEAKDLTGHRIMPFVSMGEAYETHKNAFIAGFIQGDGNTSRLSSDSHKGLEINIGCKDGDIAEFLGGEPSDRTVYSREFRDIAIEYSLSSNNLPDRGLPNREWRSKEELASFLCGLFSANGSVVTDKRIVLKSTCRNLLESTQELLDEYFSIFSYITTNRANEAVFGNGTYLCKESYNLNISEFGSLMRFSEEIGFYQIYKRSSNYTMLLAKAPMVSSVKPIGVRKVYDFSEPGYHWGTVEGVISHNCGEIILRPNQFCNLTNLVARPGDTIEDLKRKIRLATILGILQSTLTDFKYLSESWKKNCEEERLLGVSITGQMDCELLLPSNPDRSRLLRELREYVVEVSKDYSSKLGINQPTAASCTKPDGNSSSLLDTASGQMGRFSKYYIRRMEISSFDPVGLLLKDSGVPYQPKVGQTWEDASIWVFEFPVKAPDGALTEDNLTAKQQFENWLDWKINYTEHNPSATIHVEDNEWVELGHLIYQNWDNIGGLSFFPRDNNIYQQAPYESITKEEYEKRAALFPEIKWEKLSRYEKEDNTSINQEIACSGGACLI